MPVTYPEKIGLHNDIQNRANEILSTNIVHKLLIFLTGLLMLVSLFIADVFHRSSEPLYVKVFTIFSILFFFSCMGLWLRLEQIVHTAAAYIRKFQSILGMRISYEKLKFQDNSRNYITPLLDILMMLPVLGGLVVTLWQIPTYFKGSSRVYPYALIFFLSAMTAMGMWLTKKSIRDIEKSSTEKQ